MLPKDRIFAALDLASPSVALDFAARITADVGGVKVGSQLFTAGGPAFVRDLVSTGVRVFLDLKYHDIPNTVAPACIEAARLGVFMLNLHCMGGRAMMQAAREGVAELNRQAASTGQPRPLVLGVTLLTSLDYPALAELFPFLNPDLPGEEQDRFMRSEVVHLGELAQKAGLDGVVASPQEARSLRETCGEDFVIVTPGINLGGGPVADQKRTGTAGQAVRDGADYVVVGRAFLQAKNPNAVAQQMADEIFGAMAERKEA